MKSFIIITIVKKKSRNKNYKYYQEIFPQLLIQNKAQKNLNTECIISDFLHKSWTSNTSLNPTLYNYFGRLTHTHTHLYLCIVKYTWNVSMRGNTTLPIPFSYSITYVNYRNHPTRSWLLVSYKFSAK